MGYSIRSTHDIDILEKYPKEISKLFSKHDMNSDVIAYYDSFPIGFEDRAVYIDIPTKKVQFYTLSLEDLVISKLCTTRNNQDILDINSESIINALNWDQLDKLAQLLRTNKISGIDNFEFHYKEYLSKHKL